MSQTVKEVDRRLNLKVGPEEAQLLEQLASRHCRSMSGEVSWLIRQAAAELQQEGA